MTAASNAEQLTRLAAMPVYSNSDRARQAKLTTLGITGTKLWIIQGDGTGYPAVSTGLSLSAIGLLFGNSELDRWRISWNAPDGTEASGLYAVAFDDAERAWWILGNRTGRVVAGGPPIFSYNRALEIAAEYHGHVTQGTSSLPRP